MYKVFVNEKKLSFNTKPDNSEKNLPFDGVSTLEMALDLLENTSAKDICVYGENIDDIWNQFRSIHKIVEAAGGIVKNKNNELLFIHRLGKWDLPKGKIEPGEAKEAAAVREVEEETGLADLVIKPILNTTYHIYREKNGVTVLKTTHWFPMDYMGSGTAKPQVEEGITAVEWKGKQQIFDEVLPGTFRNIDVILKEYSESYSF